MHWSSDNGIPATSPFALCCITSPWRQPAMKPTRGRRILYADMAAKLQPPFPDHLAWCCLLPSFQQPCALRHVVVELSLKGLAKEQVLQVGCLASCRHGVMELHACCNRKMVDIQVRSCKFSLLY